MPDYMMDWKINVIVFFCLFGRIHRPATFAPNWPAKFFLSYYKKIIIRTHFFWLPSLLSLSLCWQSVPNIKLYTRLFFWWRVFKFQFYAKWRHDLSFFVLYPSPSGSFLSCLLPNRARFLLLPSHLSRLNFEFLNIRMEEKTFWVPQHEVPMYFPF